MRFSDQIDLSNGALRSWQAECERLMFDQSARGMRGDAGRWRPSRQLLDRCRPRQCSIIQRVLAPGALVAQ